MAKFDRLFHGIGFKKEWDETARVGRDRNDNGYTENSTSDGAPSGLVLQTSYSAFFVSFLPA